MDAFGWLDLIEKIDYLCRILIVILFDSASCGDMALRFRFSFLLSYIRGMVSGGGIFFGTIPNISN
jgi:hypothetical protein